jgi:hypothetical protein
VTPVGKQCQLWRQQLALLIPAQIDLKNDGAIRAKEVNRMAFSAPKWTTYQSDGTEILQFQMAMQAISLAVEVKVAMSRLSLGEVAFKFRVSGLNG